MRRYCVLHAHMHTSHCSTRTSKQGNAQRTQHRMAHLPSLLPSPSLPPNPPLPLPQAIEEFEWKRYLPFTISDLIELPPHADVGLLAEEGLLPKPLFEEEESEEEERRRRRRRRWVWWWCGGGEG